MSLEELGKAFNSVLDAFKTQPVTLALIMMNAGLLGFLYYNGVTQATERHHEMDLLYQNRSEMAKLLAACGPIKP